MKAQTLKNGHLFFCITFLLFTFKLRSQDFITEWIFDKATNQLQFDVLTEDTVKYTWFARPSGNFGSGNFVQTTAGVVTLTNLNILTGDTVTIKMTPNNLRRFYSMVGPDRLNLTKVLQWGKVTWTSMNRAFYNCSNLVFAGHDIPDLSNVKDMSGMFFGASSFNQDIGNWNVANVTNMSNMFFGVKLFNQDIGNWNTSNVTDMFGMFACAESFNQPLNTWNISNVEDISAMFNCATSFNQIIGNWNTANVKCMFGTFNDAIKFNQDIGNWNISNVINMSYMFSDANLFNQNIGNWSTINVIEMREMFLNSKSFNQDIGKWNTSKVINMSSMFDGASSFNQDISKWKLSSDANLMNMLDSSGLDCFHYSATLNGWQSNNPTVKNRILGASGLKYGTNAEPARNSLVNTQGWTINGDTPSGNDCATVGTNNEVSITDLIFYPNPTSGILNIEDNNGSFYSISDIAGKVVDSGIITLNTISLESLVSGMYYITIINSNSKKTNKVFKY